MPDNDPKQKPGSSYRFLLVDDDPIILNQMEEYLASAGYTFASARDGLEAVEKFDREGFDIVITDIKMPGKDGFELLRHIKEHCPEIEVIVVTGFSMEYSLMDVLSAGAMDYLAKPFTLDEFLAKVDRVVRDLTLVNELECEISERLKVESALKESEEKYRELVEYTADLVTQVDDRGVFLYVNHSARDIFGLEPAECIGLSAFDFLHPDDRKATRERLEQFLKNRESHGTFENRQVSRTGAVSDFIWTSNFHYDDDGNLKYVNGIGRDITERKRDEEERIQLIAELNEVIDEIKTLRGIIPICVHCKQIRDDGGFWQRVEAYLSEHTEAEFSHGICPDCLDEHYSDLFDEDKK